MKKKKLSKVPSKVNGVKPTGMYVLVELLTLAETLETKIELPGQPKSQQAYVLEVGEKVDSGYGFHEGDRVLMQGTFVPVPKFDGATRDMCIVDPHTIKCVLTEE